MYPSHQQHFFELASHISMIKTQYLYSKIHISTQAGVVKVSTHEYTSVHVYIHISLHKHPIFYVILNEKQEIKLI